MPRSVVVTLLLSQLHLLNARYHCPRCGGLLRRKSVTSLLDQLPCSKCGFTVRAVYT